MRIGLTPFVLCLLGGVSVCQVFPSAENALTVEGDLISLKADMTWEMKMPSPLSINRALNDREHPLWSNRAVVEEMSGRSVKEFDFRQAGRVLRDVFTWTDEERREAVRVVANAALRIITPFTEVNTAPDQWPKVWSSAAMKGWKKSPADGAKREILYSLSFLT